MATFRIPTLIWQDFGGNFTAHAITGEGEYFPPAAFNAKRDRAVAELKEHLQWLFEDEDWREQPEYSDAKLLEFRVELRPEFEIKNDDGRARKKSKRPVKKRTFTAEEVFPLRVACVYWKNAGGDFYATLPLFDIEFVFNRESELKNLVQMKIQEELRGQTPLGLSNILPPKGFFLEEISFGARHKKKETETFKEIPNLEKVAEPLGAKHLSKKISKAYRRETEVADLVKRLTDERASVIILGENGMGKTTVLTDAVRQIERDLSGKTEEKEDWEDKNPKHRFWQTNGGRLIAGMQFLGQWEERLENVIAELSDIDGVLCAENLPDLVQYGGRDANESLAAFLVPYLERGELRLICEATPAELDACRRTLPNFAAQFQIVRLPEFTAEKALDVLTQIAEINARNLHIEYSANAINLIYRLFSRFMPYQKFPGRATQFLAQIFETAAQERKKEITSENVIENFVKLTGLPELFLRDEITLKFEDVVAEFERNVIGQPQACQQVAGIVTTFKAGLNDNQRPLGVLLFAGPTGVGKTELAKVLARFFFGETDERKEQIVRVDMSEYSSGGSAMRLLTKSDGSPSDLIQKVRENPFSVVLFDEVEKADAQVFDALLGLFDEGRLTDRFGRITNFTSSVIIMTSNLGAQRFAKGEIGFNESENISNLKEIKAFFRPEFFNRLDAVVQFKPLNKNAVYSITEKEISSITKRDGLKEKNIELVWTKEIVRFLTEKGFDVHYGARPLQRTIETFLSAPLAKFLLENQTKKIQKISVNLSNNDSLTFSTN